jgi:hypothetical protein
MSEPVNFLDFEEMLQQAVLFFLLAGIASGGYSDAILSIPKLRETPVVSSSFPVAPALDSEDDCTSGGKLHGRAEIFVARIQTLRHLGLRGGREGIPTPHLTWLPEYISRMQ